MSRSRLRSQFEAQHPADGTTGGHGITPGGGSRGGFFPSPHRTLAGDPQRACSSESRAERPPESPPPETSRPPTPDQGVAGARKQNYDNDILTPPSVPGNGWRRELDDLLAELNEAESEAERLGGMRGPLRPEQRAASLQIDAAHHTLDMLEVR